MTSRMPRYGQAFLLPSGAIAPVWYDYLRTLDASSLTAEIERQVQANTEAIKALQQAGFGDYLPASAYVLGINSVETFGDLADGARVLLRGDVPAPDPSHYYGTDADGVRGFHPAPVTTDDLPEGVDNLYFTDQRARDAVGAVTGGVLPVVTGEIDNGQPVFVYADDGSLIYSEVA